MKILKSGSEARKDDWNDRAVHAIRLAAVQLAPGVIKNVLIVDPAAVRLLIEAYKAGDLEAAIKSQADFLEREGGGEAMKRLDRGLALVKNPHAIGFVLPDQFDPEILPAFLEGFLEGLTRDLVGELLKKGSRLPASFNDGLKKLGIGLRDIQLYDRQLILQSTDQPFVPLALLDGEAKSASSVFKFFTIQNLDKIKNNPEALRFLGKLTSRALIHLADLLEAGEFKTNPAKLREEVARRLQIEEFEELGEGFRVITQLQGSGNSILGINALAAEAVFEAIAQRSLQTAA